MSNYFFAYPSQPETVTSVIDQAIKDFVHTDGETALSWKAMDTIGAFIPEEVIEQISERILIADITILNCNVLYEIGYAIGKKRYILLVKNSTIEEKSPTIQEVGIFDTLGYVEYQNSKELVAIFNENKSNQPFKGETKLNLTAPVYVMNTQYETDLTSRIISRVRKANFYYRTFDPSELPRLSAHDAIVGVSESYGVLVQLLAKDTKNAQVHNLRASFIAGLAQGMGIPIKIIQMGFDPVPMDYRDKVDVIRKIEDVDDIIADWARDVITGIQEYFPAKRNNPSFLEKLDLGASAAENETKSLQNYYLRTDAFSKTIKGEVQLVVGRKGTGKSAIFYQIINKEKSSSKNVVIDLQPEGYKLLKFKEQVLDHLEEGTFQHTIMAFWEYLLLLEVTNKILQMDKSRHYSQDNLKEPYSKLEAAYKAESYTNSGDFSERMSRLIDRLQKKFSKIIVGENVRLSSPEITGLIHETNIRDLKTCLLDYLKYKERVWILFDNLDKGWPSSGLTDEDVLIIRSLIDAANRLKRFFEKSKVNLYPVIFLRSDVYYRLVLGTSDRQKEAKVSLDWTDRDLLIRLIELRIVANDVVENYDGDFIKLWREITTSHYKGEDSLQFIIDRCLMRPRFLINFINHCRSFAVNLNHSTITDNDIAKGFTAFSADILTDISLEIRDVYPNHDSILSAFYLSKEKLSKEELYTLLNEQVGDYKIVENIVEILLWYGFLGVQNSEDEVSYIYDVAYNIELLNAIIKKKGNRLLYVINPAFAPSLHLNAD